MPCAGGGAAQQQVLPIADTRATPHLAMNQQQELQMAGWLSQNRVTTCSQATQHMTQHTQNHAYRQQHMY
jgi:hypothetical protein